MLFSKVNSGNTNQASGKGVSVLLRSVAACTMVLSACACMIVSLISAKSVMLRNEKE